MRRLWLLVAALPPCLPSSREQSHTQVLPLASTAVPSPSALVVLSSSVLPLLANSPSVTSAVVLLLVLLVVFLVISLLAPLVELPPPCQMRSPARTLILTIPATFVSLASSMKMTPTSRIGTPTTISKRSSATSKWLRWTGLVVALDLVTWITSLVIQDRFIWAWWFRVAFIVL